MEIAQPLSSGRMVREFVNLVGDSKWGVTVKPGRTKLFNVHAQRLFVVSCCMGYHTDTTNDTNSRCGAAVREMSICGDFGTDQHHNVKVMETWHET